MEEEKEIVQVTDTSKFKQTKEYLKTGIESRLANCRRNNRSLLISFALIAIVSCILTFSVSQLYNHVYLTTTTIQHPTPPVQKPARSGAYQKNSTNSTNDELTESEIEQLLKYYFQSQQGSSSNSENAL